MIATMISHGDLKIDMRENGDVFIVRQSDGSAVVLSLTEWNYLTAVADLHGWPVTRPLTNPAGNAL